MLSLEEVTRLQEETVAPAQELERLTAEYAEFQQKLNERGDALLAKLNRQDEQDKRRRGMRRTFTPQKRQRFWRSFREYYAEYRYSDRALETAVEGDEDLKRLLMKDVVLRSELSSARHQLHLAQRAYTNALLEEASRHLRERFPGFTIPVLPLVPEYTGHAVDDPEGEEA